MEHDLGMGEGESFFLCAGGEDDGAAACGMTDAIGADVGVKELHGVIDGHGVIDTSAGAIDVKMNVCASLQVIEIKEGLNDDGADGSLVCQEGGVEGHVQEDDAIFEEHLVEPHFACSLVASGQLIGVREEVGLIYCHFLSVPGGFRLISVLSVFIEVFGLVVSSVFLSLFFTVFFVDF